MSSRKRRGDTEMDRQLPLRYKQQCAYPGAGEPTTTIEPPTPGGRWETLEAARARFEAGLRKGTRCPCCGRYSRIYPRHISKVMAMVLCSFHVDALLHGVRWVHMKQHLSRLGLSPKLDSASSGGSPAGLRYWGFLEMRSEVESKEKNDESVRGQFRITPEGQRYAEGSIVAPATKYVRNNEVVGEEGPMVTIRDAKGFDYEELMTRMMPKEKP